MLIIIITCIWYLEKRNRGPGSLLTDLRGECLRTRCNYRKARSFPWTFKQVMPDSITTMAYDLGLVPRCTFPWHHFRHQCGRTQDTCGSLPACVYATNFSTVQNLATWYRRSGTIRCNTSHSSSNIRSALQYTGTIAYLHTDYIAD